MISNGEALRSAEKVISESCKSVEGGCAVISDVTIEKPYGWIVFYNSRAYLETGHPLEALGGNGPIVVMRADGQVHTLGTARAPSVSIAEFERSHGLG